MDAVRINMHSPTLKITRFIKRERHTHLGKQALSSPYLMGDSKSIDPCLLEVKMKTDKELIEEQTAIYEELIRLSQDEDRTINVPIVYEQVCLDRRTQLIQSFRLDEQKARQSIPSVPARSFSSGSTPEMATDAQLRLLKKLGVDYSPTISKFEAHKKIDEVLKKQ